MGRVPGRKPRKKRRSHFQFVRMTDIVPLVQPSPRPRILSVSYDPSLLETREFLFAGAGYRVESLVSISDAIAACLARTFDLVVVGHSIPLEQRKVLVKEIHGFCSTPVLALSRPGEPPLPEADHSFDSWESPALLLKKVKDILRGKLKNG
jgi:hypothetical protein